MKNTVLAVALCGLIVLSSWAQQSRGVIIGTVTDPSNLAVPNAAVLLTNTQSGIATRTQTNSAGYFEFPFLIVGRYNVSVTSPGFKTFLREEIELSIGARVNIDAVLEIGQASESVSVVAVAPLLDTASASTGRVVTKSEVDRLPVAFTNALNLTHLAPGIVFTGDSTQQRPDSYGGTAAFTAMGNAGRNEWTMDGAPITGTSYRPGFTPTTDAVDELKVETTNFDAQSGFGAGINVNLSTKAGGNDYHGDLFDQHNQQRWNATPHFSRLAWEDAVKSGKTSPSTPKQASGRQNLFGVDLGGPVRLPNLYDGREKFFFYFGYSGIRQAQSAVVGLGTGPNYNIPSEEWWKGNFSDLQRIDAVKYTIYDPRSARLQDGRVVRTPFPQNQVPVLNPMVKGYQPLYPKPNNVPGIVTPEGLGSYYAANMPYLTTYNQYLNRFDYNLESNHRIFAKWFYSRADYDSADWTYESARGLMSSASARRAWGVTANYVWTMTSHTVMTLTAGVSSYAEGSTNSVQRSFKPSDVGLPAYMDAKAGGMQTLPTLTFGSTQGIGTSYPALTKGHTGSFSLGFISVKSSHSLKYGWEERRYARAAPATGATAGAFSFSNSYVRATDNTTTASSWGLDFASFLLGLPSGISLTTPDSGYWTSPMRSLYIHDDWRVSRRLSFNIGLRFENTTGISERFNRGLSGQFDYDAPMPYAAAVQAAYARNPIPELAASAFRVSGGVSHLGSPHKTFTGATNRVMPRIGAAYQLTPKTVLRTGYGWFNNVLNVNDVVPASTYGFTQSTSTVISTDNGLTFCCGIQSAAGLSAQASPVIDPFPIRSDGTRFDAPYRNTLGAATLSGQGFSSYPRDYSPARQQRWSLSLQRQFARDIMVQVSYNGSYARIPPYQTVNSIPYQSSASPAVNYVPAQFWAGGSARDTSAQNLLSQNTANPFYIQNLTELRTTNPVLYNFLSNQSLFSRATVTKSQLLVSFPHMSSLNGLRPGQSFESAEGRNIYRDVQVQFEKRFSKGFQSSVLYAHASGAAENYYLNAFDPKPSWVPNTYSPKHRFVWSASYELPLGKGKPWLSSRRWTPLVGGWQGSVVYEYQTGVYYQIWPNVFFYGDTRELGKMANHDAVHAADVHQWFDAGLVYRAAGPLPSGFTGFDGRSDAQPASYQIRTFPGIIPELPMPEIRNWDVRIQKRTNLGERVKASLAVDLLNLTNHTMFGVPTLSPTSLNFGRVTTQQNKPRNIEVTLRLEF